MRARIAGVDVWQTRPHGTVTYDRGGGIPRYNGGPRLIRNREWVSEVETVTASGPTAGARESRIMTD